MTPEQLTELKRLEAAATPAPWHSLVAEACVPNINTYITGNKLLLALRNHARELIAAVELAEAYLQFFHQEHESDVHYRTDEDRLDEAVKKYQAARNAAKGGE